MMTGTKELVCSQGLDKGSTKNNLAELAPRFMLDSESSLTCGLRSEEDDVKTGCKNVKLFFVEPEINESLGQE